VGEFRQIERVVEAWVLLTTSTIAPPNSAVGMGKTLRNAVAYKRVGTKNVIRLQERLKFRLIHFSSSEVYGDWPELMVETVMDEYEIKQMKTML